MSRLLILVLCVSFIAAQQQQQQQYGKWVGSMDSTETKACKCGTKEPEKTSGATNRICGKYCYNIKNQKCFTGDTGATAGDHKDGDLICSEGQSRCGTPSFCEKKSTPAGARWTGALFDEWCFDPNTETCWAGTTKGTSDNAKGDFICKKNGPDLRCGDSCGKQADKYKCFTTTDSSTTSSADSSVIGCTGDNAGRCGYHCMNERTDVDQTCWEGSETTGKKDTKSYPNANILCPPDKQRCHPGTLRSTTCGEFGVSKNFLPENDRYCFDKSKEICISGTTPSTTDVVTSGNTWVCPKDEFRCGYDCYKAPNVCIDETGTEHKNTHVLKGKVAQTGTKLCGQMPFSGDQKCCTEGGSCGAATNVGSAAKYICSTTVPDNQVSGCGCLDVTVDCSEEGCDSCASTSSATTLTIYTVLIVISLVTFFL